MGTNEKEQRLAAKNKRGKVNKGRQGEKHRPAEGERVERKGEGAEEEAVGGGGRWRERGAEREKRRGG